MSLARQNDRHPVTDRAPCFDPVWLRLRAEVERIAAADPDHAGRAATWILDHATLEEALVTRLARALARPPLGEDLLAGVFGEVLAGAPEIGAAVRADLNAVVDRDPASGRIIEPFLHFKGFAAIQTHRFAHHLWRAGRRDMALVLQSLSSGTFQVDIHPAVRMGRGIFVDHATGVVIGSTAVIEDDVSLLQGVTLGGTGTGPGPRHPTIRTGVMIGAGARVLGPVEIGEGARVAAGSVVLADVPAHSTAVGVPARIIPHPLEARPAQSMDQTLSDTGYDGLTYHI